MPRENSLRGKSGIVTGAAQGLGFATAKLFCEEGANVVLADVDGDLAIQQASALQGNGMSAAGVSTNVADPSSIRSAVSECVTRFGSLDFIHNNAGVLEANPLLEVRAEEIQRMWSINVGGVFWGSRYAVEQMREQGSGGSIINTASVVACAADPILPIYTATKHAVLGLTRALALDAAVVAAGIRVNCVCPGDMDTPMNESYFRSTGNAGQARSDIEALYPWGRMAHPSEVASAVVFLASEAASFINGAALPVDGGILARLY